MVVWDFFDRRQEGGTGAMAHWTIGRRLVLGYGIVLGIVLAQGALTVMQLRVVQSASHRIVADSLPGTALSGEIVALTKNNLSSTLEHLIATDPAEMEAIEKRVASTRETITQKLAAYEKTITEAEARALFDAVRPAREKYVELFSRAISLSKAGRKDDALRLYAAEVKPAYRTLEAAVQALSDWNVNAGAEAGRQIQNDVNATLVAVFAGLGLAITAAGLVAFLIMRSTTAVLRRAVTSLAEGAEQVASASEQVATAAQSLSQGATEQAATLEQTSASMEQMASMTRRNAENSRQAATLMQSVDRKVQESNVALGDMVSSMTAIKDSSDKISRIIKTIDEIAFQTNILALNAAVEAARAGEAGMGFAVVADEVRSLAQRSAQAARDTAALIEESIARSSEGAERVQHVAASIRAMTQAVSEVKSLVDSVSAASQEQSQGIEQVTQAIAQMEKVTQTNAGTAEESAAASEELNAQATQATEVVAQLEALVGGRPERRRARPARERPLKAAAKVLSLRAGRSRDARTSSSEDQIPLEGSGTFGTF
jgi:methyl-accepting chemotaxis protein